MAEQQDSEKSAMIDEEEDLEDGEIEDDDETEDCVVVAAVKPPDPPKPEKESSSSHHKRKPSPESHHSKKSSATSSSTRKDKGNVEEDDFMSKIENALAEGLKKSGIEPPMPNVKKQSEPDQEPDRRQGRNNRKRRKRKPDRKEQKRDSGSRKRPKVSDNDGLYMVGGSPNQSGSASDGDTSCSSYDSEEYHRSSYDERRNRRRDKYGSNRERDRERERDRKEKRNRDTEKEVCLRFAEFGHCPDDNCNRSHEVRQPKTFELCKFWLMECCAKKDKCSYLHGDFPCKYYYLGLKCVNKDCKFSHGKPLTEKLKQVLLKHLDTAPKEILGDFPRIGRDNATKMISQTHVKLCQEFNIPVPEIPSLLDMKIRPPDFKNDKKSNKNNSRWLQNEKKSPRNSPQPSAASTSMEPPVGPGDVVLADLQGILSEKQIESMAAIGVITVNHINNLTVAQLNELGLSLATIGEIQATAMNMDKELPIDIKQEVVDIKPEVKVKQEFKVKQEVTVKQEVKIKQEPEIKGEPLMDVDLREVLIQQNLDVDMRVIPSANLPEPAKSPDTIMSPNQSESDETYKKPEVPARASSSNVMMSPPGQLDYYSNYLKESNVHNDDEVEDEPGLRIDETYCTSDYEQEDRKDSQSEDDLQSQDEAMPKFEIPLLPPSFDTSNFLKSAPVVTKIDISSSVSQLMEMAAPKTPELAAPRDPRMRDPRMSKASPTKEPQKIPEIASPTYRDPRQKTEAPQRTSIYEIESPSEDEDLIKIDRDKDMRLPPFLRESENGDVDLRFPFTPMSNYVPATEIDASYGTFIFEKYEVKVVDVDKPDYAEIKRSFRQMENTQDPRLKKLCGLQEDMTTAKAGLANILPGRLFVKTSESLLDPRKRKQQESKDESAAPKKLQISTILQKSKHYNDLSSSQKMVVNEVLAELSKQLKLFHADASPNKIFDSSFISQRPKLNQILIGLGVFVNADGDFEEIKEMPMVTMTNMPNIHQLPPMIPNLPPPSLMTLNQPPPNFLAGNMRPGLLGMAPIVPFGGNSSDGHMNFPPMNNQGMPFGDQFNNRDFGSNQNNRRDQRQQNSNFRNNNRNNNYPRHRRN